MKIPTRNAVVIALALCGLAPTFGIAQADDDLYHALGAQDGIVKIVHNATTLWLADDRIKADFDNINMDWLSKHIVDQLCQLAGGPCIYKGRDMHAAHVGLHLHDAEFNALAEDLQTAMDQADVPYHVQNRLMALLAPMARQVVTQ